MRATIYHIFKQRYNLQIRLLIIQHIKMHTVNQFIFASNIFGVFQETEDSPETNHHGSRSVHFDILHIIHAQVSSPVCESKSLSQNEISDRIRVKFCPKTFLV